MHNFRLRIYLVLGLILSSSVQANSVVTPVGVNSASINSSGQVVAMHTYRAQYAGQPDSYYSRAVTYNKATTGKLGKARAFVKGNALNLGIVAATLAIGWALDEVTKDIYSTTPTPSPFTAPSGFVWCYGNCLSTTSLRQYAASTPSAAVSNASVIYNPGGSGAVTSCATDYSCFGRLYKNGTQMQTNNVSLYRQTDWLIANGTTIAPAGYNPPTYVDQTTTPTGSTPAVSPTDTAIHDAIFPPAKWEQNGYLGDNLPELLRDLATGAVEMTQEVQDVATQIQNQHNLQYNPTATPVTSPTVDPNYATTTNNPAPTSQPAFCGWASAVCDFITWFKTDTTTEPTTVALPQENLTYTAPEWSSGLGSGSCPSPNTISVLGRSFEISYQPFCTLAELIKYLVLALAYITSAMIISGVRK